MRDIRKIASSEEMAAFIEIAANAYPGFKIHTGEQKQSMTAKYWANQQEQTDQAIYGIWEDRELTGGSRHHVFAMNLHNETITAGGIGLVAVALLHKKEKIAKDIVLDFLHQCHEKQIALAMLYPFNPEFYRKMGFGFGSSMYQYRIRTVKLPQGSKDHIICLEQEQMHLLQDCYHRQLLQTNGMLQRNEQEWRRLLGSQTLKVYGYLQNGRLEGYTMMEFQAVSGGSFLQYDIVVKELVYEHAQAFQELLAFLHSQSDQAQHVIFHLQDENFLFALDDPRFGSDLLVPVYHETGRQGTGLMYRVIDAAILFEQLKDHNFAGSNLTVQFQIHDSFTKYHKEPFTVQFAQGYPAVKSSSDSYDVRMEVDVASFSSLITGAADFGSLYRYGKIRLSADRYRTVLEQLFHVPMKPQCLTMF